MEQDKTVIVGSLKDAAHAGYAQGFQEGYQAACMVLRLWPKHGGKNRMLTTWTAP